MASPTPFYISFVGNCTDPCVPEIRFVFQKQITICLLEKIRNVVDENLRPVHAFVRFAIFLRPFSALHFSLVTLTFFSFVVSPAVAA